MTANLGTVGIITYSIAAAVFSALYYHFYAAGKHYAPTKRDVERKRTRVHFRSCITAILVVITMYIAMDYNTGYFTRSDGITIFWPRYIAEAAVSIYLAVSLSVFGLTKHHHIIHIAILALAVNIGLLISAFTIANAYWAFFVMSFVPFGIWFLNAWMCKRRCDVLFFRFFFFVFILQGFSFLIYALSQQTSRAISVSLENWLYFVYEAVALILLPIIISIFYKPYVYMTKSARTEQTSIRISKKQIVALNPQLSEFREVGGHSDHESDYERDE